MRAEKKKEAAKKSSERDVITDEQRCSRAISDLY